MSLELGIIIILILLLSWYFQQPIILLLLLIPCLHICKSIVGGLLDPIKYQPTIIDMKNIKNITGPISMHIMRNDKLNKNIILFGDYHDWTPINCHNENSAYLVDYLAWLINNNSKKIDIFVELPYTKDKKIDYKKNYGNSGLISNYLDYFKDCHIDLTDKQKCNNVYPHVQFHSADIRKLKTNNLVTDINNIDNSNIFGTLQYVKKYKQPFVITQFIKNFIKIIKKYKSINDEIKTLDIKNESSLTSFMSSLFSDTKIIKNYLSLTNSDMQDKIYLYFYNKLSLFITTISIAGVIELLNASENGLLTADNFNNYETFIYQYLKLISYLSIMTMDYYLLSRMFRDFISNNIIILAGDYHINNYVDILKQMDFNILFSQKTETAQKCIDISDLPKLDIKIY